MATTAKVLYVNAGTQVTCTLENLANNAYRQSDEFDNTTLLWLDAQVILRCATTNTGVTSSGTVELYAFGQVGDAGTLRTDTAGAADAASSKPNNSRLVGIVSANSNNAFYVGGPFSVANAFGGYLPRKFGFIVGNVTGAAFQNSANVYQIFMQGIQEQGV